LKQAGLEPNVVTYSSLIAACQHGDRWVLTFENTHTHTHYGVLNI